MPFSAPITLGAVGNFSQAAQDSPQQVEAGDFNGDGRLDFLVTRIKGDGSVAAGFRLMVGQADGRFLDQTEALFAGGVPTAEYAPRVIVADFNGDGRSDVYVPDFGLHAANGVGGRDQVWLSTPGGQLAVASIAAPARAHGMSFGDIDRDGDIDVVVDNVTSPFTAPASDLVLLNNGAGAFTDNQALLPAAFRTGAPGRLSHTWSLLADLTGDGAPDLVLGTWEAATSTRPNFSPPSQVLVNDGKGSFANSPVFLLPQSPILPESTVDIDAVDINGDGLNDLVMSITRGGDGSTGQYYGTGYLQILINRGGGQFADETASRYAEQTANAPGAWWKFVRVADFNHDGKPDLLLTGAGGGAFQYNQAAKVLMNDGSGHFSEALTVPVSSAVSDATTLADVNGDGYADLVGLQWTSATGLSLVAMLNEAGPVQRTGTAGADTLAGGAANDALTGLGGNDTLDGGAGRDTAVYAGARANFTITHTATGFTVADRTGAEGTDTLANIERLQFADGKVALDVDGNGGIAYRLYQAAFDRTPDLAGLGYQMKNLDNGVGLYDVAQGFVTSPEFAAKYGALDNSAFVTRLYNNVLHRAPDALGLAYHVGNLATGATRAEVLAAFSESPENKAALLGVVQNGMDYLA
ncbi:MAG: FG-GAP-like repeat-containing protein [Pseudomonadota bacterium]